MKKLFAFFEKHVNKINFIIIIILIGYLIPMPYIIYVGGGVSNVSDKYEIIGTYESEGSFNHSYVNVQDASLLTYALSFIIPSWELEKKSSRIYNSETIEESNYRDKIYMDSANSIAVLNAYKTTNKEINFISISNYVVYIDNSANTTLRVGDELLEVDGIKISNLNEYSDIIKSKNIDDIVTLKVSNKDKIFTRTAKIYEAKGKTTGIYFIPIFHYEASPSITFKYKKSESGPSGGLMLTLSIIDALTKEDLTKGKKIVGTGTIDEFGNIGEISGVKYKLQGAVHGKCDLFIVPNENYEEVINLVNKHKYKIEVKKVGTLFEALEYLQS